MVLNKRFIYSNGITTGYFGNNSYEAFYANHEKEVETLFQEYQTNPAVLISFEFRLKLIKLFLRLARNIKRFFVYNVKNNNHVSPLIKEYLLDTLKFIKTGQREIPISICKHTLLTTVENTSTSYFKSNKLSFIEELDSDNTIEGVDLLIQWISLPNGIEDLLWFTKLIFSSRS